ncbi:TPA: hypothetical protein JTH73_001038 [Escherichia coli]|nr:MULTISPECIES: hypothetical protein [Enterobacteriaceae]EGP1991788.1 hypothetical protein [Salmonella enterica subsp. enterica serovar Monschaui]EFH8798461.1 hypothetical protein [Escherichia coli]EIH4617057.1 hypothetical protein [Escherichia coli]EIX8815539.1 hypothetical protein [Escherichia coli]EJC2733160.1 hypothetical protein [Escherichia coli]
MKRSVEITDNSFFSIFADAVLLYDLALSESNDYIRRVLSKSSILSVNYALEAAVNSFLESVDLNSKISNQVDRFSTLDKFDFILQWHKGISLPRGEKETQVVKRLIELRNNLVHPKVKTTRLDVMTSRSDGEFLYCHKADVSGSFDICKITKMTLDSSSYSPADSLIALQSLVAFLNKFIEGWWGIDLRTSEFLLMRSWDGSIQACSIMYEEDEVRIVLKHNHDLNVRFVGLYGILEDFP